MRNERQKTLELHRRTNSARAQVELTNKQRSRLLIALAVMLIALGVLLVRDREFWFGPTATTESDTATSGTVATANPAPAAKTIQPPVTQTLTAENHSASKTPTARAIADHKKAANPSSPSATNRRPVLPPLQVEVVARDTHRTIHPAGKVAKVELPNDSKPVSGITTSANLPTNAAERESLSTENVPELRQTVDSTYPVLGPRMKVQGSVVLQAVIGADGTIENLRVLSGPAILTAAAQQAVREWRFKPYLQNGEAVETKATITVNFSIRISDNPAKTS